MEVHNKRARPPEIIRKTQKDIQYTSEITKNILEVIQTFSPNQRQSYQLINVLSNIFYHGHAGLNSIQTLGEEYTGIIQTKSGTLPSRLLYVISVILEFAGESALLHYFKKVEMEVCHNEDLTSEARDKILNVIRSATFLLPYLKILHRTVFYFKSGYLQISKRLTGINYVLVRFWLKEHHSVYGYKFLGIFSVLQVTLSLLGKLKKKSPSSVSTTTTATESAEIIHRTSGDVKKCVLCLESRSHLSATQCGHLFCWKCISDMLSFKNECPMCRETIKSTSVILLQNYS